MRKVILLGLLSATMLIFGACGSPSNEEASIPKEEELLFEDAEGFPKEDISKYKCIICGKTATHVIEGIGADNGGYDYEFLCDDCFNEINGIMELDS